MCAKGRAAKVQRIFESVMTDFTDYHDIDNRPNKQQNMIR